MAVNKYSGLIEAALFFENEVISKEKLMKITGLSEESLREIMTSLIDEYEKPMHGIHIIEVAEGYLFQIKKDAFFDLKQIYNIKEKSKLTRTVMTVLSIIAYKQPITKAEIEKIRGVASDNAVRILLEKNLIEIAGRKDVLGKPLMYGTTKEFLRHFNLKSINDLPQLNELKSEEFVLDEDEIV